MEELTGIRAFDWVLAAMYAVAAVLIVGSPFWRSPGTRVRGVLVLPLAVGLGGIAALALTFPAETRTFLGAVVDKGAALVVAALVVLVSVAIADFLVSRVPRWSPRRASSDERGARGTRPSRLRSFSRQRWPGWGS